MPRGSLHDRSRIPRPSRRRARCLAVALLAAAAGCYQTVNVAPGALAPGANVRIDLTSDGERELAPRLGDETVRVEGRVETATPDAVGLVVSRTVKKFGGTVPWIGERVTIPTRVIAHAGRRDIDRQRTTLAAAGAAAAAIAAFVVLVAQHGAGRGDDGGGGGGPTP